MLSCCRLQVGSKTDQSQLLETMREAAKRPATPAKDANAALPPGSPSPSPAQKKPPAKGARAAVTAVLAPVEMVSLEAVSGGVLGKDDAAIALAALPVPDAAASHKPLKVQVGNATFRQVVKFNWCVCQ